MIAVPHLRYVCLDWCISCLRSVFLTSTFFLSVPTFPLQTTDAEGNKERVVPAKLKTAQDAVDAGFMKTLKKGKALTTMGQYMKTRFTLSKGMYPHDLKF
jgi:hypothetical protein